MLIGIDASRAFKLEPTGTETYSKELIRALTSIDKDNQYRLYLKNEPTFKLPQNFSKVMIKMPKLWTQFGLALECLKKPPELLFVPAHTLPILRRFNLKTVVTIHDLGAEFLPQYHTYPSKIYLNMSTIYAVKFATKIIAVSAATKNDLIGRLGADPAKIEVIYEGYDSVEFKIINDELKIRKILSKYNIFGNYILFVGTLQPRKNLERLIEAFSNVLKNLNLKSYDLQLVLVGKKGWLYDDIYAAPKKFGVEDKVRFLDYVELCDLPILYNQAKVFVLPSLLEGFGLPALEAMACGCPVIVADRSSLPEIVEEAGFLVDPDDVSKISQAIEKVVSDRDLAQSMIAKGLKQAQKFSWQKTARQTLSVFEKAAKS